MLLYFAFGRSGSLLLSREFDFIYTVRESESSSIFPGGAKNHQDCVFDCLKIKNLKMHYMHSKGLVLDGHPFSFARNSFSSQICWAKSSLGVYLFVISVDPKVLDSMKYCLKLVVFVSMNYALSFWNLNLFSPVNPVVTRFKFTFIYFVADNWCLGIHPFACGGMSLFFPCESIMLK